MTTYQSSLTPRSRQLIKMLVKEHLRHAVQQAVLNAVGIMLVVTMLLALMATSSPTGTHPSRFANAVRDMIGAMACVATAAAMVVLTVSRISQVKDRTREFAILRVFGCSFGRIAELLLLETIWVALPGTVAGIVLAQINDSMIAWAFGGLFSVKTPYLFWLPAGLLASACFFSASLLGARSGTQMDVLDALGEEH